MRLISPSRQLLQTRGLHQFSLRASLDPHALNCAHTCSQLLKRPQPRSPSRISVLKHTTRGISGEQTARDLNQQGIDEALSDFDTAVAEEGKDKQQRAPWHRQGAQEPPVKRQRSAGAMTKGKSPAHSAPLTILTKMQGNY